MKTLFQLFIIFLFLLFFSPCTCPCFIHFTFFQLWFQIQHAHFWYTICTNKCELGICSYVHRAEVLLWDFYMQELENFRVLSNFEHMKFESYFGSMYLKTTRVLWFLCLLPWFYHGAMLKHTTNSWYQTFSTIIFRLADAWSKFLQLFYNHRLWLSSCLFSGIMLSFYRSFLEFQETDKHIPFYLMVQ